jgi:hypothetical protein
VGTDEHQILEFLKTTTEFITAKEVSRRVGGRRRCEKDPMWAKPCLIRLTNAGHLTMNERGHFCYKPPEEKERSKKAKDKLHLAPQIAAILAAGGKGAQPRVHELREKDETSDF